MSQQPPGPYPAFPQYPGGAVGVPPKPPVPQPVQRAHYCILAGGALTLLGIVATFTQTNAIRSALETTDTTVAQSTINSLVTATIVFACLLGLIEVGLWVWMAFATKAGKNWARVLSTVFFGLSAAGTVFGTLFYFASSASGSSSTTFASSDTTIGQVASWLEFLAGLAAIILLWSKQSSAYFKPPMAFYPGPYGYPGMPPQGLAPQDMPPQGLQQPYTYPVMPQQQPGKQGKPRDPWGTPPGN
jgi:hypothetical protein